MPGRGVGLTRPGRTIRAVREGRPWSDPDPTVVRTTPHLTFPISHGLLGLAACGLLAGVNAIAGESTVTSGGEGWASVAIAAGLALVAVTLPASSRASWSSPTTASLAGTAPIPGGGCPPAKPVERSSGAEDGGPSIFLLPSEEAQPGGRSSGGDCVRFATPSAPRATTSAARERARSYHRGHGSPVLPPTPRRP